MTLKEILRHIRDVHRPFTTPVRCGINDCTSTASTYDSLRQHLYKKHRSNLVASADCHSTMSSDVVASAADIDNAERDVIDNAEDVDTRREASGEHILFALTNALEMGRFILKIRDGKGLTQVVTDGIVRDMQSLIERSCESLKEQLVSKLNSFNKLLVGEMKEVEEIFLSAKDNIKCGELETQQKQDIFFQDNFNYVVSAS